MLEADWLARAGRAKEALTVLKTAAETYGAASVAFRLESLLAQCLISSRDLGDSLSSWRLWREARTLAPEHPEVTVLERLVPIYLRLRKQVSTPVGTQASGATASAAKTARLEAQEGEIQRSRAVPEKFLLEAGYPNPFNPSTTLRFGLPADAQVRLVIYDLLGREVAHLADGLHEAGYHTVTWHAQQAASGCYLARLTVTGPLGKIAYVGTSKLLLTRVSSEGAKTTRRLKVFASTWIKTQPPSFSEQTNGASLALVDREALW